MARIRASLLLTLLGLSLPGAAHAQRFEDAYGWYLGGQGGMTRFETPAQTAASIPTVGAHLLVMVKTFGLYVAYDRAFEEDQVTSYPDPTVLGGQRDVTFDVIHRGTAAIVAFPWRGAVEPFVGGGLGLYTLGGSEVAGPFANEDAREEGEEIANNLGSRAFVTGIAGLQLRTGRVAVFVQYQVISNGGDETLFEGALHGVSGGLRVRLGSTRGDYTR